MRLSESLADEVKEFGLAVNILDPGWNLTRPNDDYDDEVHKRKNPAEDIAEVAVFVALQTSDTMLVSCLHPGVRRGTLLKTALGIRKASRLTSTREIQSRQSLSRECLGRLRIFPRVSGSKVVQGGYGFFPT